MKTLKILTGVCIVALVAAIIFGAINISKTTDFYAENPEEPIENTTAIEALEDFNSFSDATATGYSIGDVATDFNLRNIDNTYVSLADYPDAAGFVIIFTCNHCPYSKAYEDRIIAIDKEYKEKGYPVIAINPNNPTDYPEDSFENMQKRADQKGFTFPYLFDEQQEIYPQYGATKTPHVFLLRKENDQPIVKYIGAIDDNHQDAQAVKNHFLKDAIDALLTNQQVNPETTVAIGCSIKK